MYPKMLLSEKIAESIIDGIRREFYKPGDQMPNELQLSEELGVSRATLREAFKVLISKNILVVRRGIGTFVSDVPGFSYDALGLQFIDLKSQKNDLEMIMKALDYEELRHFHQLAWEQQKDIVGLLQAPQDNLVNMIKSVFKVTERTAFSRGCEFRMRMLMMVHESYLLCLEPIINEPNAFLKESLEGFAKGLSSSESSAYYDDFLTRLGMMMQEVTHGSI